MKYTTDGEIRKLSRFFPRGYLYSTSYIDGSTLNKLCRLICEPIVGLKNTALSCLNEVLKLGNINKTDTDFLYEDKTREYGLPDDIFLNIGSPADANYAVYIKKRVKSLRTDANIIALFAELGFTLTFKYAYQDKSFIPFLNSGGTCFPRIFSSTPILNLKFIKYYTLSQTNTEELAFGYFPRTFPFRFNKGSGGKINQETAYRLLRKIIPPEIYLKNIS